MAACPKCGGAMLTERPGDHRCPQSPEVAEDSTVVAQPAAATFLERILVDDEIVIVTKRGAPIAVVLSPGRAGRLNEQLADAQIAELLPPLSEEAPGRSPQLTIEYRDGKCWLADFVGLNDETWARAKRAIDDVISTQDRARIQPVADEVPL